MRMTPFFATRACYPEGKKKGEEEDENKGGRTKLIYTPMAQELAVLLEYCSHVRLLSQYPPVASIEEEGGREVGESLARFSLSFFFEVCNEIANEDEVL